LADSKRGPNNLPCKSTASALKRDADCFSGPTVEKGLAALDSLYDLRNVIPGLIASSNMDDQEGEHRTPTDHRCPEANRQHGIHSGCPLFWLYRSSASMPTHQSGNAPSPTSNVYFSPRTYRYLSQRRRYTTESSSPSWTSSSSRLTLLWQRRDCVPLACCARCSWRTLQD
jgi:hypothetical protein